MLSVVGRCYDFKTIFAKKNIGVFPQTTASFLRNMITTLVRSKLSKIAENCDYNIDPWSKWRWTRKNY
jgi:hypothetical protein